jgi:phosphoglycolate phosphatase
MSDPAPLRLLVFDVDGTLVDSQAHIMAAMEVAFGAFDRPPPPRAEVLSIVGLSLPEAMARLVPGIAAAERDALVEAYKNSFATVRANGESTLSPLYPGARTILDGLLSRDDILVGVATGKSRRGLDHVLRAHGLNGAFVTEQVADGHPSKPHPSMLYAALSETGAEAGDAIMVGDTTFDIEMGRAAGFATIGVSWGYHPTETLHDAGADCVIDTWADLPATVARIWGI